MKRTDFGPAESSGGGPRRTAWPFWTAGTVALLALIVMLWLGLPLKPEPSPTFEAAEASHPVPKPVRVIPRPAASRLGAGGAVAAENPEEIVARRLAEFVQSRRGIVRDLAALHGLTVPAEVEAFFDLAQSDRWEDFQSAYLGLSQRREQGELSEVLAKLWPALLETYGVVEITHQWPARALLDYGDAVLGSLPPGSIYVGGTDAGRFIPTLLSETAGGDAPVVLTQNAFADASYLEYARFVHGDRLAALTAEDSANAFQSYVADAQRRFMHDREFPQEPKQVRPGEQIEMTDDGRISVGGQVSVMAINETLLQTLMAKNPGVPFAMEESFPFKSANAGAVPNGPLLELRGTEGPASGLTSENVQQSLDYWQAAAARFLDDPDAQSSPAVRNSWSKLALAQAGLLQDQQFGAEAEMLFQYANQLAPDNPEGVFRYVELLREQDRWNDARSVVETALGADPGNEQFQTLLDQLKSRGAP